MFVAEEMNMLNKEISTVKVNCIKITFYGKWNHNASFKENMKSCKIPSYQGV